MHLNFFLCFNALSFVKVDLERKSWGKGRGGEWMGREWLHRPLRMVIAGDNSDSKRTTTLKIILDI